MRELALSLLIVVLLFGLALLSWLPWESTLDWGWWTTAAGMILGVPTGVVYHIQLYRALSRRAALPEGWIWRPIQLNAVLTSDERRWVMPWCVVGGFGFLLVAVGLVMIITAIVVALVETMN